MKLVDLQNKINSKEALLAVIGLGYVELQVRGTLGILARARREKRILSLREVLDRLRARGTWIEQELYEEVLRLVGE